MGNSRSMKERKRVMTKIVHDPSLHLKVSKIFKKFDQDKDGFLVEKELVQLLSVVYRIDKHYVLCFNSLIYQFTKTVFFS